MLPGKKKDVILDLHCLVITGASGVLKSIVQVVLGRKIVLTSS